MVCLKREFGPLVRIVFFQDCYPLDPASFIDREVQLDPVAAAENLGHGPTILYMLFQTYHLDTLRNLGMATQRMHKAMDLFLHELQCDSLQITIWHIVGTKAGLRLWETFAEEYEQAMKRSKKSNQLPRHPDFSLQHEESDSRRQALGLEPLMSSWQQCARCKKRLPGGSEPVLVCRDCGDRFHSGCKQKDERTVEEGVSIFRCAACRAEPAAGECILASEPFDFDVATLEAELGDVDASQREARHALLVALKHDRCRFICHNLLPAHDQEVEHLNDRAARADLDGKPIPDFSAADRACIAQLMPRWKQGVFCNLMVQDSVIGGQKTVVASAPIKKGTIICNYPGALVLQRGQLNSQSAFIFKAVPTGLASSSVLIDALHAGNISRFIDGAPRRRSGGRALIPNLAAETGALDGRVVIILRATRNIPQGDVLFYDYGAGYPNSHFVQPQAAAATPAARENSEFQGLCWADPFRFWLGSSCTMVACFVSLLISDCRFLSVIFLFTRSENAETSG